MVFTHRRASWHATTRTGSVAFPCFLASMAPSTLLSVACSWANNSATCQCHAKSTTRSRWVILAGSEEGASRLLAAGGMGALLRLLDGACHAALLPLALSTLAGAAAAWMHACTGALQENNIRSVVLTNPCLTTKKGNDSARAHTRIWCVKTHLTCSLHLLTDICCRLAVAAHTRTRSVPRLALDARWCAGRRHRAAHLVPRQRRIRCH